MPRAKMHAGRAAIFDCVFRRAMRRLENSLSCEEKNFSRLHQPEPRKYPREFAVHFHAFTNPSRANIRESSSFIFTPSPPEPRKYPREFFFHFHAFTNPSRANIRESSSFTLFKASGRVPLKERAIIRISYPFEIFVSSRRLSLSKRLMRLRTTAQPIFLLTESPSLLCGKLFLQA